MSRKIDINLTNQNLIREIDRKKAFLATQPEYQLVRNEGVSCFIKELFDKYCWDIHHPHRRVKPTRSLRNQNNYSGLSDFFRFGINGHSTNFEDYINNSLLLSLAELFHEGNQFRTNDEEALIFEGAYEATKGFLVRDEMEFIIGIIREGKSHPINKSAYSHLGLIAIQPFKFANKRVARFVRNKILFDRGYPIASVRPKDTKEYLGLLEGALVGYTEGDTNKQKVFFDFLGEKMNNYLDRSIVNLSLFDKSRRFHNFYKNE